MPHSAKCLTACCYNFLSAIRLSNCRRGGNRKCFSIKGIGTYLVDSVIAADTIAVSTCIVVIAAIFVVANFMADIINRLLCPWMVREENDT